ncbi:MAG: helix-turn-helix transcriptional regulator [Clostridia bacterium]|nr:helix-turn-helix transcriptional regulator [Clostridia bacterium]
MAFNSNGQVSYLVLDSLSHGSKYGLEIIEYISTKTGGNYLMKKPTLYSCLTRMEKKGLVSSSYWGESTMGGKRHYYTITNDGKKTLEELTVEFANATYESEDAPAAKTEDTIAPSAESSLEESAEQKPMFLHQDNIFNLMKEEKPATTHVVEEKTENVVENQIDIFSFQAAQPATDTSQAVEGIEKSELSSESETKGENAEIETESKYIAENITSETNSTDAVDADQEKIDYYQSKLEEAPQKDDAKLLEEHERLTAEMQEQNRRLYDTSSELKKYRKRKSFSENQIEMTVVYERADEQEIQKARIEELKASMLSARQNRFENEVQLQKETETETPTIPNQTTSYSSYTSPTTQAAVSHDNTEITPERIDDAVFITEPRIQENQIPIQRKITPPNIEIDVTDDNLPAPKRNSELEPTYKDMMAKLFERKKEKAPVEPATIQESENFNDMTSFVDYGTLKKYYSGHGIEFKEYKKANVQREHNTNFLTFISSLFLLLLSGTGSTVLFLIINGTNLLSTSTNFFFYTSPALFAVYTIFTFIRFKVHPSKKANLTYNSIVNWAVFVLAAMIIFVINIFCGMQFETMHQFLTSLLVPIYSLALAFPVNYYIKKFLFGRYAR